MRGSTRTTLAVRGTSGSSEGVLLGWIVGVEWGGRLDALPERMYGFVPAVAGQPVDLDHLYAQLRKEFGGKFTVNFPPTSLGCTYVVSLRPNFSRYHANDTFVLRASTEVEAWELVPRVGRQGVRKAEREGVEVSLATDGGAWMRYLGLHVSKNARRHAPVLSRLDLDSLRENFGNRLGLVVASRGNVPLAAVAFVVDGAYGVLVDNASQPEHWHLNPNNLAVWEAVRECIRRGAKVVDFGFSAVDDEGGARFKEHMGASRCPVYAAMSS
jgi:hypothetical protein